MVEKFKERRDYVLSRLNSIPGMKVSEPKGAFYVFPNISSFIGDNVSHDNFGPIKTSDDLCQYILSEALVIVIQLENLNYYL